MIRFKFLNMISLKNSTLFLAALGLLVAMGSCSKKSRYEKMVSEGLASGVRHDTLFLGLSLGMASKDFYSKCWKLNKQGLIRQGSGNSTVLYELKGELKSDVDVNFYPTFFKDRIYEMPVKFQYKAWAPWNKQFSSDTLQVELKSLFEKWYGPGFMTIYSDTKGTAYVKVDGNRRISIYKDQTIDGAVWALYTDMSVEQQAEESRKKENNKTK